MSSGQQTAMEMSPKCSCCNLHTPTCLKVGCNYHSTAQPSLSPCAFQLHSIRHLALPLSTNPAPILPRWSAQPYR